MSTTIAAKLSKAFWPNRAANESANVEQGNAAVDKLSIGELAQFYNEIQAGPTYCMVTRRVQELLEVFPPHIENKKVRALAALEAAKYTLRGLNTVLDS